MSESESDKEKLRDEQDVEIQATVLPSTAEQLSRGGKADLDLRHQIGEFESEFCDGEIMVGMTGKVWIEFDSGPRVTFDLNALTEAALQSVKESEEVSLDD